MPNRVAADIAAAGTTMLAALPVDTVTRWHAEGFSWDATTRGQLQIFRSAVAQHETC
jgi:hypothetical protein